MEAHTSLASTEEGEDVSLAKKSLKEDFEWYHLGHEPNSPMHEVQGRGYDPSHSNQAGQLFP